MAQNYSAVAKQNPGRNAWLVEFRHPMRLDSNNKPGRKTRKGLGTDSESEAQQLVSLLNQLLRNEGLWSIGGRPEAEKLYGNKITEIFFSEIEPRGSSALQLRDKLLPLPSIGEGYARVLLLGVPGAGKTTLLRQLIGTNPKSERFPSTSVNRTTTFPTEVALRDGAFEGVVTFMSEHETRFEIEEAITAAMIEVISGNSKQKVARSFLENSDMRFRLKYLLGDYEDGSEEPDPYEVEQEQTSSIADDVAKNSSAQEQTDLKKKLGIFVDRIIEIAIEQKDRFECVDGRSINEMSADDQSASIDKILESAVLSDAFAELTSEVLEELRTKFDFVTDGHFEKTTTGWPKAWHTKKPAADRSSFLFALRFFSDNHYSYWGKLLTPLVNSMRVVGPFKPNWADEDSRLVLVDTEGLGHKADSNTDLPEHAMLQMHEADIVLFVESAKSGMTNFQSGKALEAVVSSGLTRKLAVVFTCMDLVKGDNLKGPAKKEHVFGGLRNIVENQLAKSVSVSAARELLRQLESKTFYVGRIDEFNADPAKPELNKLLRHFIHAQPAPFNIVALPEYRDDKLGFAIQEAAREFRTQWKNILGFGPTKPKPWQAVKALSRRYAEGWDDGFSLRPTSNLESALRDSISRFLETPIKWEGNATPNQQRETIDLIKSKINREALSTLSTSRLRGKPQLLWQEAYTLRGAGTTRSRANRIEAIFSTYVPVPEATSQDREVWEFLDEVKGIVTKALDELKNGN